MKQLDYIATKNVFTIWEEFGKEKSESNLNSFQNNHGEMHLESSYSNPVRHTTNEFH